jgi:hypothetical protein
MMIAITILMYTASLDLQLPPCINILNLCPNTKLVSPVYFGSGAVCPKLSDRQIDIDAKTNVNFEIKATQDDFEGALLFKLQRYVEHDDQSNMNMLTTETNENETMHIYMLAVWQVENSTPFVYITLVEHTKNFTWNEDKLKKLYDKNFNWFKKYNSTISVARLMYDNMILRMTFRTRYSKRTLELNIYIFEEEKDNYTRRPYCINFEK